MTKKDDLKEEIHKMNGLIGRISFTIDEFSDLIDDQGPITRDNVDELISSFDELKNIWKTIKDSL